MPELAELRALVTRRDALERRRTQEMNRLHVARAEVWQSVERHISYLEREIKDIDAEIQRKTDDDANLKKQRVLLAIIPAVRPQTGSKMPAVMKARHFQSAGQLAAYLGLVPVERQSGSSVLGQHRLSKTGPAKLRAVLHMAAVVAVRHNPHARAAYDRLLARSKSKMSISTPPPSP